MTEKRRLTADEWALARRRWEGADAEGFDWLAQECRAAFGDDISVTRQSLNAMANRKGWAKGGPKSKPLAVVAQPGEVVGGRDYEPGLALDVAQPGERDKPRFVKGNQLLRPKRPDVAQHEAQQPQHVAQHAKPAPVELEPGEKPEGYAGTGRPSAYRPEYDQMIIDWFDVPPTKEVEVKGHGGATRMQTLPRDPPMLGRFAHSIGVSLDTLNRWATSVHADGRPRYPSFAEAYARARQLHEALLVEGATIGVYDGRTANFVLKNLHGWKDQIDVGVKIEPVSLGQLEAIYGSLMQQARERMAAVLEERAALRLGMDGE